jgi:hypothetical protein
VQVIIFTSSSHLAQNLKMIWQAVRGTSIAVFLESKNMLPLERAGILRQEADIVMELIGLHDILRKYANVFRNR